MSTNDSEYKGSKAIGAFIVILIVLNVLTIMALMIKCDVGEFGSKVLRPVFKNVPVVNYILPNASDQEVAIESDLPYDNLESALKRVEELEDIKVLLETEKGDLEEVNKDLSTQISRLQQFEDEQTSFEEKKSEFFDEIVYGEEAPSTDIYKEWYEELDEENAERIYNEVISQKQVDSEIEELAKTYSSMDEKSAAGILEKMSNDLDTVALILSNMSSESRGKIMGALDPQFAANVTKKLIPQ